MRVVSLLPSATEILFEIGVEPVGVSHSCDWPPCVENIPTVTSTSIDQSKSSPEIDTQVVEAAEEDSIFSIDVAQIQELDPDLVVTQGICDVCAIDERPVKDALTDIETTVVSLDAHTVHDIFDNIEKVGEMTGNEQEAHDLVEEMAESIFDSNMAADGLADVVVLDWLKPMMTAGHWVPELVEAAGGRSPLSHTGDQSRRLPWNEIIDCDPDYIMLAPCGLSVRETRGRLHELIDREGWKMLTAVTNENVFIVDGNFLMNRPGPRVSETARVISRALKDQPPGDWRCQRV